MTTRARKVRFSESNHSASFDNTNTRIGQQISPTHKRPGASRHARSVNALRTGAGAKLSFSRSPSSPPTPYPRSAERKTRNTFPQETYQERPISTAQNINLPLSSPSAHNGNRGKRSSTSALTATELQAVPASIVKRQATRRQQALDIYARRRFEPILHQLAKVQAETEKQLASLQGLFADVANGSPVTLFGVPHGKAPDKYAPLTPTKEDQIVKGKEKGSVTGDETESEVAEYMAKIGSSNPSDAQKRNSQKLLRKRKRATKNSASTSAPRRYSFQGFVCCRCQSTNGQTTLVCHSCEHGYDSYGCRCVDIYS